MSKGNGKGGDSAALLALGAMVVRAINDLAAARAGRGTQPGYTRRTITYPGGSVVMMLCSNAEMADIFEAAALVAYNGVDTITPKSEIN
jgi:hypothetical protein